MEAKMATESDTYDPKSRTSPWLNALVLLVLIHTASFVTVSLYQFNTLAGVDEQDVIMKTRVEEIKSRLKELGIDVDDSVKAGQGKHRPIQTKGHRLGSNQRGMVKRSILTDILKAQEQVIERHCSKKNKTCASGSRGDKGALGMKGEQGEAGLLGPKGQAGPKGTAGLPGTIGDPGPKGTAGVRGDIGPSGYPGMKGDTGSQGPSGLKGDKGDTGIQGTNGTKGEIGEPGQHGPPGIGGGAGDAGDAGSAGIKGTKGDPGDQGPKGQDALGFLAPGCQCLRKPFFSNPANEILFMDPKDIQLIPCQAAGSPTPNVTVFQVSHSGKRGLKSSQSGQYYIDQATGSDYGRYICQATNKYGSATKYVEVKPKRVTSDG